MNENLLNYALNKVQIGHKVLFLWSGQIVPEIFQTIVEKLRTKVGTGKINTEHFNRLSVADYSQSTFDCILVGLLNTDSTKMNDTESLTCYLNILKPNGFLIMPGSVDLETELKLNGFKDVNTETIDANTVLYAAKPSFEIGSASKLKFASKNTESAKQPVQETAKIWKFTEDDIQEDDLIDTDALLDDDDLKKPVNLDKFDCGTSSTGKKKACKNCSCGLAEELEAEVTGKQKQNAQSVKSACGSCYLGDAFRCASCPYLGMPPFKPGEKVQIADNLLKADI